MRNVIYKAAFVSALTATLLSCNKRLNEVNPSGATADATWSTPEGFITNVNGAYQQQRAWYGKEDGPLVSEAGSDLWFNANKSNYANQVTRYEGLSAASPSSAGTVFRLFYQAINVCNAGIGRIDNAGFTNQDEKNRRLGELRFLRAFYYWHIVEQFGGVNLRTTEVTTPELTATRSPVSAFYDLIIGDLKFAADNLPLASYWGTEYSRASKKSALGLLARVYLSRAYYATGTDRTNYFTLADNTAKEVISRKGEFGVDLWTSPTDLWNPSNNKNNKEALYIISNSTNTALDYDANANRLHAWFLTQYSNKPGLVLSIPYGYDNQRRLQPTRYLLDLFDETKDARYAASFQETWIANNTTSGTTAYTWTAANATTYGKAASVVGTQVVSGRDLALQITKNVVADKATKPWVLIDRNDLYNTNGTIKSLTDFVALKKFLDYTRTVPNSQPGYNDIMVIRLAEMYLIAAEAEFQLGNYTGAAAQLNVLRTRAAIKTPIDQTAAMQTTAAAVQTGGISFILEERARELCGEHLRWFDLKRTLSPTDFAAWIKAKNPDITAVQPFHTLRPVPLAELNALTNGAEFGQNPGY
ncbi:RagB/SusD family nutrient uptake outer membrane protein [Mucilaginibacter robiniae]|uniref:RagB/SusD family nutrient uptake outer membrane protein n=1 Tax=Mucilaginibacter robiniae TaxID=2728022 RepID=A0A7L5DUB1_9SPHI|nr:RagB/SusD family nutrient uptake outer membrane protein [Mucilaginibacter robiniae]QJD94642.1 RagB/SusD family nutrient uptake outer membrane protein [Mucilaginibacter robiniae]